MSEEILLLTGTIAPSQSQNYGSTSLSAEVRKVQYLKTIIYYITQTNFKNIIFSENSDYKFDKSEIDNIDYLSKLYDKEIELLQFKGNYEKVNKMGYGFGEGECIDYAFDNSRLLKSNKHFYKITGRYIIGNINKILENTKYNDNLFYRNIPAYFSVNTAFFLVDKQFYKKYFYGAKENVNYAKNINFETVYYNIINKNNLFRNTGKLSILPHRINCNNDTYYGSIHRYNIVKREPKRYDYILLKCGIYNFHKIDKLFYDKN